MQRNTMLEILGGNELYREYIRCQVPTVNFDITVYVSLFNLLKLKCPYENITLLESLEY